MTFIDFCHFKTVWFFITKVWSLCLIHLFIYLLITHLELWFIIDLRWGWWFMERCCHLVVKNNHDNYFILFLFYKSITVFLIVIISHIYSLTIFMCQHFKLNKNKIRKHSCSVKNINWIMSGLKVRGHSKWSK